MPQGKPELLETVFSLPQHQQGFGSGWADPAGRDTSCTASLCWAVPWPQPHAWLVGTSRAEEQP